jgi:hypothetical protein
MGKTLYVQAEQGAGDRVLMHRYIDWVKKTWPSAKIKFSSGVELAAAFCELFDAGVEYVPDHRPWPTADFGVFLGSLPRIHGTTASNVYPDPGYIRSAASKVRFVPPPPRVRALKVGIAWTGNPDMTRNQERSIPFGMMFELADNPYVQLYSLQFEPGRAELYHHGAEQIVHDLVPLVSPRGYIGTAAAALSLDLVITACTSLAHVAGAVGVPTWVLLCHDPYWVWLREGTRTKWYPSARLFRQPAPGDWGTVIDEVKVALAEAAERKLAEPEEARVG